MEDEIFYLYLVDPSKRAEAIAGLSALSIGRGLPLADAQVRQGRWDFAQLGDWYGYLALKGAFGQGIVSADIQEARNRLEYGVPSESDRRSFEQWLTLLGVPCHLVAIGLEQPFVPLSH